VDEILLDEYFLQLPMCSRGGGERGGRQAGGGRGPGISRHLVVFEYSLKGKSDENRRGIIAHSTGTQLPIGGLYIIRESVFKCNRISICFFVWNVNPQRCKGEER
jgi:hypothetical protein